jgi:transcriptional regulator with XRE-family HTH domain
VTVDKSAAGRQNSRIANKPTLTDQVRKVILESPLSRYELAKLLGCRESTLSDFVNARRGLSSKLLDRVAALLQLRLVQVARVVLGKQGKRKRRK